LFNKLRSGCDILNIAECDKITYTFNYPWLERKEWRPSIFTEEPLRRLRDSSPRGNETGKCNEGSALFKALNQSFSEPGNA